MLVFSARAIHLSGGGLSSAQKRGLFAWLAEVCIDERFGGAPPHMIQADWRALTHRLDLPSVEPARPRDDKTPLAKECWRFSMAWARSRGVALVLASHAPVGGDGEVIADPYAVLAEGTDSVGMLIAEGGAGIPFELSRTARVSRNSAALRSPANRVICPRDELPKLRQMFFDPECEARTLSSHLITAEAHRSLIRGDLDGFFEVRRVTIIDAERRWVIDRGGVLNLIAESRTYSQG